MIKKEKQFYRVLIVPGVVFLFAIIIIPIVLTFIFSFQNYNFANPSQKIIWVGFKNYFTVLTDRVFGLSLLNTIIYVFSAVSVEFVLGLIVALLIFRVLSTRNIIISLFLLPSIMAPIVIGMIFRFTLNTEYGLFSYLLNKIGLFRGISILGDKRTALGSIIVADIWQWAPFIAVIILAGLITLPEEPFEAAKIDGASELTILTRITLPLLVPVIRIAVMLRIVDVIKEFDKIFVMTEGGPGMASETVNFYAYRVNFRFFDMGKGSAQVIIIMIIIVLFSIILFKILKTNVEYI